MTDSWICAWNEGKTGWEQDRINRYLPVCFASVSHSGRVFVPLCGASVDMFWLWKQGYEVVGTEVSQRAVELFSKKFSITFSEHQKEDHFCLSTQNLTILLGDHFSFEFKNAFDFIWDRGSFVAIEPNTREDYTKKLITSLKEGGKIFLECFEYDSVADTAPPHSIEEGMVRKFYAGHKVKVVQTREYEPKSPRFQQAGVQIFTEKAYEITKSE